MRKGLRADLSGPVLAIIITVAIIAAGLVIAAYFWWLAPHASKTPTITIVGEPSLTQDSSGTWHLYLTVKNDGTDAVQVNYAVINGVKFNPASPVTVNGGDKADIEFTNSTAVTIDTSNPNVSGSLITNGGVYPFNAYIVS